MMSNARNKISFDTLARAKETLEQAVKSLKITVMRTIRFDTVDEFHRYLQSRFTQSMQSGNFSYDPGIGEIIITYDEELDTLTQLGDKQLGVHLKEYFLEQGWTGVVIIPRRLGVRKTLVRLQSDQLLYAALAK